MANQIKLKNGSGSNPSASDLVVGEVALRTDNASLFTKKDDGTVAEIGAAAGVSDGDKGDITVSNSGATFTIDNDAVTYAKIQNVSATNRILGRDSSGAGVIEEITPANLRTMINVENGATADQTASEILTLIKTVDGAGSGLDADTLDGVSSGSFLRSNADDSFNGTITAQSDGTNPVIKVTGSGPNFIQFASDSSGTVDADSINFVYRTSPNTLAFERASDATILFSVDADNAATTFGGVVTASSGFVGNVTGNASGSSGSCTGNAATATEATNVTAVANNTTNTAYRVPFLSAATGTSQLQTDNANGMSYNPSNGNLTATSFNGSGASITNLNASSLSSGTIPADRLSASDLLTKIKTVDGQGSGLDADTLDGIGSGSFLRSNANDTATGQITLQRNSTSTTDFSLHIRNEAAAPAQIKFSNSATNQNGFFFYRHEDAESNSAGNSFHFNSDQSSTAVIIDQTAGDSGFYVGTNEVWHAGNDGAGSGLDADTLDGAQPSVSAGNNTIVKRHSSGYIFANFFNTTPNDVTSGVTKVCVETGNDGYIRHGTAAAVRSFLNVEDGATAAAFPSGTRMLFQQTSAPTGWTKDTSDTNNRALRVVSGSAGSGGSVAFTTAFASKSVSGSIANATAGGSIGNTSAGGTVSNHTLSTSQIPAHNHSMTQRNAGLGCGPNIPQAGIPGTFGCNTNSTSFSTNNTGGGGSHNHGFSGSAHNHSFSGSAHNHSFSGTAINLAVQYLDVIIAEKS